MGEIVDQYVYVEYNKGQIKEAQGVLAMSTIATTAVYENGVIRPLEKLDLPERQELYVFILPVHEQERQQTLADVLGFDPTDEEKLSALAESQYQAVMQLAGGGRSGRLDVAEKHDEYLYGDPHR